MAEATPVKFEEKDGPGWIEIVAMTAEEVSDLRQKCMSTVVCFPETQDGDVRLTVNDHEEIIGVKRPKDQNGNVIRVEFKVLDTNKFGTGYTDKTVVNIGGFIVDGKEVENTQAGKDAVFEDPKKMVWMYDCVRKLSESNKQQYGGESETKNS